MLRTRVRRDTFAARVTRRTVRGRPGSRRPSPPAHAPGAQPPAAELDHRQMNRQAVAEHCVVDLGHPASFGGQRERHPAARRHRRVVGALAEASVGQNGDRRTCSESAAFGSLSGTITAALLRSTPAATTRALTTSVARAPGASAPSSQVVGLAITQLPWLGSADRISTAGFAPSLSTTLLAGPGP